MIRWSALRNPAFITAVGVLVVSAIALAVTVQARGYRLRKLEVHPPPGMTFTNFPTRSATWERFGADPPPLTDEVLLTLGTRNYLTRTFRKVDEDGAPVEGVAPVQLHLAYYTGMIDTVPHVPERCYVGGGMSVAGQSRLVRIPLDMSRFPRDPLLDETPHEGLRRGRTGIESQRPGQYVRLPREVEELTMLVTPFAEPQGDRLYAGYFFLANGGVVASAEDVRLLAFNLTDDYAYYAKVQFMSESVDSAEELGEVAADFLNEMLPEIMLRVPDWADVLDGVYPPDRAEAQTAMAPTDG